MGLIGIMLLLNLQLHNGILGFGRYGNKKYIKESDESWTTFEHPSYISLETLNKILRRMMKFYDLDPETHHCEVLNQHQVNRERIKVMTIHLWIKLSIDHNSLHITMISSTMIFTTSIPMITMRTMEMVTI